MGATVLLRHDPQDCADSGEKELSYLGLETWLGGFGLQTANGSEGKGAGLHDTGAQVPVPRDI